MEDAGNYRCVADNGGEQVQLDVYLEVDGKGCYMDVHCILVRWYIVHWYIATWMGLSY